jgi:hypothetical protein
MVFRFEGEILITFFCFLFNVYLTNFLEQSLSREANSLSAIPWSLRLVWHLNVLYALQNSPSRSLNFRQINTVRIFRLFLSKFLQALALTARVNKSDNGSRLSFYNLWADVKPEKMVNSLERKIILLFIFLCKLLVSYVACEIYVFGININRWRCSMGEKLCFSSYLLHVEQNVSPKFPVCLVSLHLLTHNAPSLSCYSPRLWQHLLRLAKWLQCQWNLSSWNILYNATTKTYRLIQGQRRNCKVLVTWIYEAVEWLINLLLIIYVLDSNLAWRPAILTGCFVFSHSLTVNYGLT